MRDKHTLGKVILRTVEGDVISGFSNEDYLTEEEVKIISPKGQEKTYDLTDLKAVFFVKDFGGDAQYREVKFLNKQSKRSWLWVRVHFFDDEVIEGKIRNNKDLIFSPGFYLWPSDEETNNDLVYVVKHAIKDFTILALQ